jgi:hypothetical protein
MVKPARRWLCALMTGGALLAACALTDPSVDGDRLAGGPAEVVEKVPDAGPDAGGRSNANAPGDGGACAPGSAPCSHVVFVTSETFKGNDLADLAGADAKCNAAAAAATNPSVRGGKFKAWLSTTATSAADRLAHHADAYTKPSGEVVAKSWSDLVDGSIDAPIDEDENGKKVTGKVWTGSTGAGEKGPKQCDEWGPSGHFGRAGSIGQKDARWTSSTDEPCRCTLRLYCVAQ